MKMPQDTNKVKSIQKFVDTFTFPVLVTTYDVENPIILASNAAHEKLTGFSSKELIGLTPTVFKGELTERDIGQKIKRNIKDYHWWAGKVTNYTKTGRQQIINLKIMGAILDNNRYFLATKSEDTSWMAKIKAFFARFQSK
jgi:PAS domain S-box-containing protein